MSLSLITDVSSFNEIPVPLQNGLLVDGSTLNLSLKARCTVTTLFVLWNSSTHQLRCCEVSAILHFTALWRRAGAWKISLVNVSAVPYLWKYSSKFWFYNYLKSRSFFVVTVFQMRINYKSILHYKHIILPTCFNHSCGHNKGNELQRMDTSRYYKSMWTNAQV